MRYVKSRDVSQGLKALAVIPEDLGSISSSCRQFITIYNVSPRRSDTFFRPVQTLGIHVSHRHICKQIVYTYKNKYVLNKYLHRLNTNIIAYLRETP